MKRKKFTKSFTESNPDFKLKNDAEKKGGGAKPGLRHIGNGYFETLTGLKLAALCRGL